jgi:hypothetical protein
MWRLEQMETACDIFLSTYEAHAPISRQRVVLWEALDTFTLVVSCWAKIKTARLQDSMLLLERHVGANRRLPQLSGAASPLS